MKLVARILAVVLLGLSAILIGRVILGWVESTRARNIETQIKTGNLAAQIAQQRSATKAKTLELESQIWNLETPAQRKSAKAFAKRLANMSPDQLIAACGKPDRTTAKKEGEGTLRTLEYDGYIEMAFRYPKNSGVALHLESTGDITSHRIGSWAWGQELAIQLPCVKAVAESSH